MESKSSLFTKLSSTLESTSVDDLLHIICDYLSADELDKLYKHIQTELGAEDIDNDIEEDN